MKKTIRIVVPQWMGGANPDYYIGADILALIAPPSKNEELFKIDIKSPENTIINPESKIVLEKEQLKINEKLKELLVKEKPDRAIIFGGDCSISQVPFDYFNSKYKNVGIIWLDSHPDISTTNNSNHVHEMVLSHLLRLGNDSFSKQVENKFEPQKVLYAGLVEDATRKMEMLNIYLPVLKPQDFGSDLSIVKNWLKNENIEKLCIHFDLDVLSPKTFKSLTSSKPHQTLQEYGAAVGELELPQIIEFLNKVNQLSEIICLSIAEFIPWDIIQLREGFSKLPIFEAEN